MEILSHAIKLWVMLACAVFVIRGLRRGSVTVGRVEMSKDEVPAGFWISLGLGCTIAACYGWFFVDDLS